MIELDQQRCALWQQYMAKARYEYGETAVEMYLTPFAVAADQSKDTLVLAMYDAPHLPAEASARWKQRIVKWFEMQDGRIKRVVFVSKPPQTREQK